MNQIPIIIRQCYRWVILQKEKEKQQQLLELQEKITVATKHYNEWLLKYRAMLPWKQFITKIHEDDERAIQFHVKHVSKVTLLAWKQHFEFKCEQRNRKADQFYVAMVTKSYLTVWKKVGNSCLLLLIVMVTFSQYVQDMKHLDNHAIQWYKWLLVQRCFKSWHGRVRQQQVRMWEKERRAKVHYHW